MLQSLQRLVIPFTRLVKVATSLPLFSVFPRDHSFLAITDHGLAINTVSFMASTEISRDSYCSEWSSDLYHWSFPWLHFPAIPHNHRLSPFKQNSSPPSLECVCWLSHHFEFERFITFWEKKSLFLSACVHCSGCGQTTALCDTSVFYAVWDMNLHRVRWCGFMPHCKLNWNI